MRRLNPVLLFAALWELVRFVLLFLLIVSLFVPRAGARSAAAYWLLFYGAGCLLMPAGMVLLLIDPARYAVVIHLVRLGKVLQAVPVVLMVLTGLAAGDVGLFGIDGLLPLAVATVVDLVFLGVLLSFRIEAAHGGGCPR